MPELLITLPLFLGAIAALVTRGRLRAVLMLAAPFVGAYLLWSLDPNTNVTTSLMGMELTPVRLDRMAILFGYLFHLASLIGVIYSLHLKDTAQLVASLSYAACAVGAVCAGDLLTLFLYWEGLAVTSAILILARRSCRSLGAGFRYLVYQACSGMLLLAGILLWMSQGNDLRFDYIGIDTVAGKVLMLAFGIKACFTFLHSWLTDAYPEGTATGTVFLSAFTTKVGVYALARGFPGEEVLVYIGLAMACTPIFYAVVTNDLRRVLAYSLINQIGFMVVGIGIGTELALNGAVAHAFNDVLFKGLLMMSMGAILHVTGEMRGSHLGGFYKTMPKTAILCMVGAASISAFPLFNGFVSKSMIMSAAIYEGYDWVWLGLAFAAAGVFHHAGIKIPFFAFFAEDSKLLRQGSQEPPRNMIIAMTIAASLCIGIGCYPQALYALLPYTNTYNPYTSGHVLSQLQLLAFASLAFVGLRMRGLYPEEKPSTHLDMEWTYRRLVPGAASMVGRILLPTWTRLRLRLWTAVTQPLLDKVSHHRSEGSLARHRPTGSMALWVAVLLVTCLLLFY
ncbi:MAG: Na(+)/H(+) antiporter subunit D [Planctomycetota bacterium]